jgi:hypothetical protein
MHRAVLAVLSGLVALVVAAPVAQAALGPPIGKHFNCYNSFASTNAATGAVTGYNSAFRASLVFANHGPIRYSVRLAVDLNNTFRDSWTYAHGVISFRRGFFGGVRDSASGALRGRVVGRYVRKGVAMPHSTLTAARYTIVLRSIGTPSNDGMPPRTEGTDFRKATFWYCTTSKPTLVQHAPPPANPAQPVTPPIVSPPPPPPPASSPHPPYGIYSCRDKNNTYTNTFTLTDPFLYNEANSTRGAFTFDETSGRIDFQGGKYDSPAINWHLYGTYQSAGTIVLASTTQTTAGGPDADEIGSHTLWHCSPI